MQILSFNLGNMFMRLCLLIDTMIYRAVGWMYSIFYTIASSRVFSNEVVSQFLGRMYSIIGVVMLFIVAYSLLNVIINPDNLSKGKSTPSKIVFNIVLSLISIIFIPTIFNFGFSLQGAVMQENVLGKLILGTSSTTSVDNVAGGNLSVSVFEASFYLDESAPTDVISEYDDYTQLAIANNDIGYFDSFIADEENVVTDGYIHYNYILCGLIGCFVLYCLLVFCFDVGLRAVKLMFLEVIAPLPSLLLIVPGQDKVFKAWVKETLRTFLSLFLRVILIFFGIFLINAVDRAFESGTFLNISGQSTGVVMFAKLFVILGVLMFIKQAPKLMETLFGIKLEGGMLDLKKRLNESGLNSFAGMVGGGIFGAAAGVRGAKARGVTDKRKLAAEAAKSVFNGVRNGRGGVQNIGKAYDYSLAAQKVRARGGGQMAIWANALRGETGFGSYYDYQVKYAQIEHDSVVSPLRKQYDYYMSNGGAKIKEIDHKYETTNDKLKHDKTSFDKFNDEVTKYINKEDSDIKQSMNIIMRDESGNVVTGVGGKIATANVNLNHKAIEKYKEELGELYSRGVIDDTLYGAQMAMISSASDSIKNDAISKISSCRDIKSAETNKFSSAWAALQEVNNDVSNGTFAVDQNGNTKLSKADVIVDLKSFKAVKGELANTTASVSYAYQKELMDTPIYDPWEVDPATGKAGGYIKLHTLKEKMDLIQKDVKFEDTRLSDTRSAMDFDRETYEEMRKQRQNLHKSKPKSN